jgi:hypothetical protein
MGELADKKWALHSHQHGDTVAAEEPFEEEGQIAAVKQRAQNSKARGKLGRHGRGRGSTFRSGQQSSEPLMPN